MYVVHCLEVNLELCGGFLLVGWLVGLEDVEEYKGTLDSVCQ